MNATKFLELIGKLSPEVIDLIVKVVRAIGASKDPQRTAKAALARALEEQARLKGFDQTMRLRRPH